MTEDLVRVDIEVEQGSLTPEEVQGVLDEISIELLDPNSSTSRAASELGLTVRDIEVMQDSAFVLEAFLISMAVKFAGGAAGAGGALFFNKVIKPRIVCRRADGVGEIRSGSDADADGRQ